MEEHDGRLKEIYIHLIAVLKLLRPQHTDKPGKSLNERFTDVADWVSSAMGTPANISFWVGIVVAWFLIFALHPSLQYASFMPTWFTSTAFNFPLNSITTLAELYIGFLCAAATNRAEKHLKGVLHHIAVMNERNLRMEREHGQMLQELREVLVDLHSHTTCDGHTTIGQVPDDQPAPARRKSA